MLDESQKQQLYLWLDEEIGFNSINLDARDRSAMEASFEKLEPIFVDEEPEQEPEQEIDVNKAWRVFKGFEE